METITINIDDISNVDFHKQVIQTVSKQITSVPFYNAETKLVESLKMEYGIKFMVAGTPLKHILNMATLNSKTDIGNNFRARCKKDVYADYTNKIVSNTPNNDTVEYFKSMLNDNDVLVVNGFPTALPETPVTPEQRKRTAVALFELMSADEQTEYLKTIGGK